ncbi:hypothetical protein [Pseudonocardia sp. NPDC049154]|uniref:hypothetical protein n=1 Tax=Pseudonocardia sp. NPDC049154 TaxID=3155501 RepID=UPI003410E024
MSRAGVFFHRIVRAIRTFFRAFRTAGPGAQSRSRSAGPSRPWPRCIACHRPAVADLCPECGVCTTCCNPENHEKEQDPTE